MHFAGELLCVRCWRLESLLSSRVDKSDGLRDLLLQLSSSARDHLRTGLIRDDRDEIAQVLLRYGDANGVGWARRDRHVRSRRIFQWVESASIARLRGRGLYFSFLDTPAVSSWRFLQAEAAPSSYGGSVGVRVSEVVVVPAVAIDPRAEVAALEIRADPDVGECPGLHLQGGGCTSTAMPTRHRQFRLHVGYVRPQ